MSELRTTVVQGEFTVRAINTKLLLTITCYRTASGLYYSSPSKAGVTQDFYWLKRINKLLKKRTHKKGFAKTLSSSPVVRDCLRTQSYFFDENDVCSMRHSTKKNYM